MRKIALAFLLVSATASGKQTQKELLQRLSDEQRKWIEQDVRYITTDRERDLFLTLDTLDERERLRSLGYIQ
jgi:hypothetical protein